MSQIRVGTQGQMVGREVKVLGEIVLRNTHNEMWQEWYLQISGGRDGWLELDEGNFRIWHSTMVPTEEVPAMRRKVMYGGKKYRKVERGTARLESRGGHVPLPEQMEASFNYMDAVSTLDSSDWLSIEQAGMVKQMFWGYSVMIRFHGNMIELFPPPWMEDNLR